MVKRYPGLALTSNTKERKSEPEQTLENVRYLKIAISLALGSDDIRDMPKTKAALNELYNKIERIYHTEDRGQQRRMKAYATDKTSMRTRRSRKKDDKGNWNCFDCQTKELDRNVRVTPNSIRPKQIVAERKWKKE
jgi:hypothetical protein